MSSGMTHNTPAPLRPYMRKRFPAPLFERNYSIIDFEWDVNTPIITHANRNTMGESLNIRRLKWEASKWNQLPVDGVTYQMEVSLENEYEPFAPGLNPEH